jgi:formate-dependent nitrite reductase cytochrome c552 subunit
MWYYFTPKYTRVGYQPFQPVAYSHATHVEQLGMDCRYCHQGVEQSWHAGLPASSTCMNCHSQVLKDDPRLALVRQSAASGTPIAWTRIHRLPDYVFFHHAVHVKRGVSCLHCHGPVNLMEETRHAHPLSMLFCLNCHRNPGPYLQPPAKVYQMDWQPPPSGPPATAGPRLQTEWRVEVLDNCSACHR